MLVLCERPSIAARVRETLKTAETVVTGRLVTSVPAGSWVAPEIIGSPGKQKLLGDLRTRLEGHSAVAIAAAAGAGEQAFADEILDNIGFTGMRERVSFLGQRVLTDGAGDRLACEASADQVRAEATVAIGAALTAAVARRLGKRLARVSPWSASVLAAPSSSEPVGTPVIATVRFDGQPFEFTGSRIPGSACGSRGIARSAYADRVIEPPAPHSIATLLSALEGRGWTEGRAWTALRELFDVHQMITSPWAAIEQQWPNGLQRAGYPVFQGLRTLVRYKLWAPERYRVGPYYNPVRGGCALAPVNVRFAEKLAMATADARDAFHLIATRWLAAHSEPCMFAERVSEFETSGLKLWTRAVEIVSGGFACLEPEALGVADDACELYGVPDGDGEVMDVTILPQRVHADDRTSLRTRLQDLGVPVRWRQGIVEELVGQGLIESTGRLTDKGQSVRRCLRDISDDCGGDVAKAIDDTCRAITSGRTTVDEGRRVTQRLCAELREREQ